MKILLGSLIALTLFTGCKSEEKNNLTELWVYTSMYKDTISNLTPKLKKDFPGVEFKWFQAGSEEIASKVNAEILSGGTKADVLISSDRFWYEEMAQTGGLHAYAPKGTQSIPKELKHANNFYTTVSIPVMVLAYNKDAISEADIPKSFKELSEPKWKDQFTTGSPLASGTNFTTMAMLAHHYGWKYFEDLKKNNTIAQGGNSAVIRRLQSKERSVGWVLLENLLRFQGKDDRIKAIFPSDGVVTHTNVMAITKKEGSRELAQKFADWMFTKAGQMEMTNSYMYSPIADFPAPKGAPEFSKILEKSFKWSNDFLMNTTKNRMIIKEKYTEIMFQ